MGGRVDLLAIAPDCALILIELKRNRTPRAVVAQAIDYASWVENLETDKIAEIYSRFSKGRSLAEDFEERFGSKLDEETLNESHQIIIVAESLDDSSERIVSYLGDRGISINVLCFQVFALGNSKLLSRAWLLDPVKTQTSAAAKPHGPSEPWNGEFYCSYGSTESRSWEEAVTVMPNVRGIARRFAQNDRHEADELTQVIALKFLECWPKFRGEPTPARIGGWCKVVAQGAVLREWERRRCYRRNLVRLWSGETSCKAHRGGRPRTKPAPKPTPSLF